jgi:hypothetical protein
MIVTDGTDIRVADIMAHATILHLLPHSGNGCGELLYIFLGLTKQMKNQSECRLASDSWQLREFRYSLLQQL